METSKENNLIIGKSTESTKGPSTSSRCAGQQIAASPQPEQLKPEIVALQTEVQGEHEGDLTVKVLPSTGKITISRQPSKKEKKIEQIGGVGGERIYNKTPVRHVSL